MAEHEVDLTSNCGIWLPSEEIWLRVRTLAAAIPPNVDLSDDFAVTRALFLAGFVSADFRHVLSLAIERAQKNRAIMEGPEMTFPKAMKDKWDQAAANPGVKIPLGANVVCDSCNQDYTDSPAVGGMIFDSNAICPACEPKWRASAEQYHELDHIRAVAAAGQRFQEFVVAYRGPDAYVSVSGVRP